MAGLGTLSFLTPLILFALLSLPLIWWLLRATPPAPDRVRFPAFIILRQLVNRKETPDKTPWWLIALRLFLAACLIIGLAGPIINAPEKSANNGPLVLVVDNTFAAAHGWSKRRAVMEEAAETIRQSDRPAFVITSAPILPGQGTLVQGPLNARELRNLAADIQPEPFIADRRAVNEAYTDLDTRIEASGLETGTPEFWWLTDNLRTPLTDISSSGISETALLSAMRTRGAVKIYQDRGSELFSVTQNSDQQETNTPNQNLDGLNFMIKRRASAQTWRGTIVARGKTGRELDRQEVMMAANETEKTVRIDLPIALQNDLADVRLEGRRSASAIWLADARDRRALIGLIETDRERSAALLSGNHYIRQAMAPFAAFQSGDILSLTAAQVSVIMLDDVGRLRRDEEDALRAWLNDGGVLVRFAGAKLADAALDGSPSLIPVDLRRGERALGGTLTWATPQPLGEFSANGPFDGLLPPTDVLVRQQVLAEPGGETSARTWASLTDGTPLVTGAREGKGLIVLFHIGATPLWSDLPISEIFIDMLKRVTFLSAYSPQTLTTDRTNAEDARFAPVKMLTGFGGFTAPLPTHSPVTTSDGLIQATPQSPPGLYGSSETPIAINTVPANTPLDALSFGPTPTRGYTTSPPRPLWVFFFTLALLALLLDLLATLFLRGLLSAKTATATATTAIAAGAFGLIVGANLALSTLAMAQTANGVPVERFAPTKNPLDLPINERTAQAALSTRFAFVRTETPETNRLAELGLIALSQELSRRTTVSPALPVGVDLKTDDLSVYPILYWPVEPGMETIDDTTLAQIEDYMRLGGLIIFDTRDDERAIDGVETAEAATLRKILTRINIPPLTRLPKDHVLTRSYYLLPDLRGRTAIRPVWVAAGSAINDGVTPLIIGGRDWIGAWARYPGGAPLRPVTADQISAGERAREMAYRSGINMAMVAFTGNYKTDQVHTGILLKRLGE